MTRPIGPSAWATRNVVEIAWAGEQGPRIFMLPLFSGSRKDDGGVIEVHCDNTLSAASLLTIDQLRRIYRNMCALLQHSDRDALTGFLNRKFLDDAFNSAVLEKRDGMTDHVIVSGKLQNLDQDRRYRVPANYWLGSASIDNFGAIYDAHGHLIAEKALVLAAFERFRANVEKFNFPQVEKLTVSCGFARVLADDSPSSALEKMQRAVEFTQRSGSNRYCRHLGLVRRGGAKYRWR